MAKTTANLGLIKPERSDNYSVDVMSENMDKIDSELQNHKTKITAIESEVNGDLVCDSVTADLSPSFEVNTTDGVVSSFYINSSVKLATASQYGGGNQTKTYTYRKSAISDTCTLRAYSYYSGKVVFYVNNVEVLSHQVSGNGSNKSVEVTLNDGDIVKCVCTYANDASQAQGYIELIGYLIVPTS